MSEQPQFDFDVFISYSSKDEDWVVKTLLPRVEQAGLKVCIDFRDFKPGKPSLLNMQHAVRHSRHTLLVLTANWFGSEWTLFESILSATKDPAGFQQRTIPLLLQKSEMPENADFIAALTYIDFTRADRLDLAWRQLLTALGAPPEPEPPKEPQRDHWFLAHPYPMPPNFTGRVAERALLNRWLDADAAHPLLSVRALGGFGKSALAWHWLTHDVAPAAWPRVVWWSFYEGDASFDHFLAETLDYLSGGKIKPETLSVNEVRSLMKLLEKPGTLLVLDGFERALRAFGGLDAAYQGDEVATSSSSEGGAPRRPDSQKEVRGSQRSPLRNEAPLRNDGSDRDCVSPLAEQLLYNVALQPHLRSKVLLTTRLCPRVLEASGGGFLLGCREEELKQMQPADAVEFFCAQGIRGTHTEIEAACAPYGYHPLSLRLLAGLIVGDFQQPGDIAAAKRLDVSGDLVQRQHHVLETAYNSLTLARQALLGRIACFRSPVKYEALKALAETARGGARLPSSPRKKQSEKSGLGRSLAPPEALDADLRDLVARGLLHHETKESRFDLHPIVRRYAYDRLAAPDRADAHTRLRDYFAAVPKADKVTRLEDLAPVIELYHHTVHAGQFDEAGTLYRDRLGKPIYFQLGAYQLQIDLLRALFPDGEHSPPRLRSQSASAWTLNELANSHSLSGQPRRAVPLWQQNVAIRERQGKDGMKGLAIALGNVAYMAQIPIGALRAAEANLSRSIALCREIKGELWAAVGRLELGRLLSYRGAFAESETELAESGIVFDKHGPGGTNFVSVVKAYRALRELLRLRCASHSALRTPHSALESARRALELADETARTYYPHELDYVRAHWLLGAGRRFAGQPDEAERHLHQSLERCRRINAVWIEADILIDLARLLAATGAPDEAQRFAKEALVITERSGYVLQGADAHLELAKLALARGDQATALEHASEARRLATCDGPPDYTYKVAYDEAGALLVQLKKS